MKHLFLILSSLEILEDREFLSRILQWKNSHFLELFFIYTFFRLGRKADNFRINPRDLGIFLLSIYIPRNLEEAHEFKAALSILMTVAFGIILLVNII